MLTVEEAQSRILATIHRTPVERLPLLASRGMVLAEDVTAGISLPPFANSAMDGYALRAADAATAPANLKLVGVSAAGCRKPPAVGSGEAVRIFTGAPMPEGADAVVMQEITRRDGDFVEVLEPAREGRHIRPVGDDVPEGTLVFRAGTPLPAAAIGMLAALGRADVAVYRRPRIAILSTGDELVPPGASLRFGQIYDSNKVTLQAQVQEAGGVVSSVAHAPDNPEALRAMLEGSSGCDLMLTSGGVSVGDYDFVKDVLADEGSVDFWKVAVKPGKPLAFGSYDGVPFVGLPGNPVSSFVTFELFVRPAIRQMLGYTDLFRHSVRAVLEERVSHGTGRREYMRAECRFEGEGYRVRLSGEQDSAAMRAMAAANALLIVPEDTEDLEPGALADVLLLGAP